MLAASQKNLRFLKIYLISLRGTFFSWVVAEGAEAAPHTTLSAIQVRGAGTLQVTEKPVGGEGETRRMCQSRVQLCRSPMCPSGPTEPTWVALSISGACWWGFPARPNLWACSGGMRWDKKFGSGLILMLQPPCLQTRFSWRRDLLSPLRRWWSFLVPSPSSAARLALGYRSLGGMDVVYPVYSSFTLAVDSSSKDAVIFLAGTAQHDPSEHLCGASSLSSPSSPSSPVFASHTLPCCSLTPYSSSSFLIRKPLWPVLLQAPPFHKMPCAPWGAQACTRAAGSLPPNQGSQYYPGTGWIVLVCSAWPAGCVFSALGPPCAWPWAALAAGRRSGSVQQNPTLGLGCRHRNFSWLQLVNGSRINNVNLF